MKLCASLLLDIFCDHSEMSDANEEIIFWQSGSLGRILLNRPKFLNALNLAMVNQIQEKLDEWNENSEIGSILIEGKGERAFCAGGDIKRLAESARNEDITYCREFFSTEFRLNRNIFRSKKPWIAILDGITMGGGVGLSIHGKFQITTEKTKYCKTIFCKSKNKEIIFISHYYRKSRGSSKI